MGKKRQICFNLDEGLVTKMEKVKEETGIPISRQLELKLKGYEIRRSEKEK